MQVWGVLSLSENISRDTASASTPNTRGKGDSSACSSSPSAYLSLHRPRPQWEANSVGWWLGSNSSGNEFPIEMTNCPMFFVKRSGHVWKLYGCDSSGFVDQYRLLLFLLVMSSSIKLLPWAILRLLVITSHSIRISPRSTNHDGLQLMIMSCCCYDHYDNPMVVAHCIVIICWYGLII